VESRNVKFIENDLISGNGPFQDITSENDHYETQPIGSNDRLIVIHTPQVQIGVRQPVIEIPQTIENDPVDQVGNEEQQNLQEDHEATLRRSNRVRRSIIPSDYVVYLQELDYNIRATNDPKSFSQAMSFMESNL